jgi:hypothetical protein
MTVLPSPAVPELDVHQHLWPEALVEELRRRTSPPRLIGWTLLLDGEPPFEVDPRDHDGADRARQALGLVGVSLSSPLGIESLPPDVASPLLDAWHDGAAALPRPLRAWAAVNLVEPDLDDLAHRLDQGFLGLQLPASALATPAAVGQLAPVLRTCEERDVPVLVHPGPAGDTGRALPSWWAPVVDYTAQLSASWWAWTAVGRTMLPELRICFVGGAGLAPLQHERFAARGGGRPPRIDPLTFVEISSYGSRAVDALLRVLGIDVIVNGTDLPYAGPIDLAFAGDAAARAIRFANPVRLLAGGRPHDDPGPALSALLAPAAGVLVPERSSA